MPPKGSNKVKADTSAPPPATTGHSKEAAYAHFPNAMLLAQFVNKLWCADHGKSLLCTCGR